MISNGHIRILDPLSMKIFNEHLTSPPRGGIYQLKNVDSNVALLKNFKDLKSHN